MQELAASRLPGACPHPDLSCPYPDSSCPCSPEQSRLAELEEQAKSAKKGMWSEGTGSHTIRDLKYTIENPRHFVDSMHQKPVNGKLAPTLALAAGRCGRPCPRLPACPRPQGPVAHAVLFGCCSRHPLAAESCLRLRGSRRAPLQQDRPLCFCSAAIIEHVRDGSVVRALLLPDYYLVTVMLSGIKVRLGRCPLSLAGTLSSPLCTEFLLAFAPSFTAHPPRHLLATVQAYRYLPRLPSREGWRQGYGCLVARRVILRAPSSNRLVAARGCVRAGAGCHHGDGKRFGLGRYQLRAARPGSSGLSDPLQGSPGRWVSGGPLLCWRGLPSRWLRVRGAESSVTQRGGWLLGWGLLGRMGQSSLPPQGGFSPLS